MWRARVTIGPSQLALQRIRAGGRQVVTVRRWPAVVAAKGEGDAGKSMRSGLEPFPAERVHWSGRDYRGTTPCLWPSPLRDRPPHRLHRRSGARDFLRRNADRADRWRRSTCHANAFLRHRVALYRWLLRLVGDEALAEDLLSEVFLDVWRQAASSRRALRFRPGCWRLRATRRSRRGAARPRLNWTTNSRPRSRTQRTILSLSCRRSTGQTCYANPWQGCRRSTARSLTWCTITANPSKRSPRLSASTRPR